MRTFAGLDRFPAPGKTSPGVRRGVTSQSLGPLVVPLRWRAGQVPVVLLVQLAYLPELRCVESRRPDGLADLAPAVAVGVVL